MAKRGAGKPGGRGGKPGGRGGDVKVARAPGGVAKSQNLKAKLAANRAKKGIGNAKKAIRPASAPSARPSGRHTLLLKQETTAASSRTWSDYASTNDAVDGFVSSYEAKVRGNALSRLSL